MTSKERVEKLEKSVKNLEELVSFLLQTGIKLAKTQQNQTETTLKVIDRIEQISTQSENDVDETIKEKAKKMGYKIHSSVDELIKDSQIISLHIPSTVQTENTIDEKRIRLMNENSIIINTARGDLIDETALIKALKDKKIGGAALDVYREEPLKNMDLCSCEENLVLTPHIGSQTEENQSQASIMIAEKISDYLKNLT